LPQVIAPIIGGLLLDAVNRIGLQQGYVALMLVGAGYFVSGSLLIWRVRAR